MTSMVRRRQISSARARRRRSPACDDRVGQSGDGQSFGPGEPERVGVVAVEEPQRPAAHTPMPVTYGPGTRSPSPLQMINGPQNRHDGPAMSDLGIVERAQVRTSLFPVRSPRSGQIA